MTKKACFAFLAGLLFFLSGCWNSIELDDVAMVMGAGMDKSEEGMELSVEILQSGGGISVDEAQSESFVISAQGETLFDAARTMMRKAKRRLFYTHTNIWVMSEALAREHITEATDLLRRDQMPRLNSMLLITKEAPQDILNTTTITEDLTSVEMAGSMEGTQFTSQFEPMDMKTVFEMLSGPVPATFIPIVHTNAEDKQTITELKGMAVIKNDRMIGELDPLETKGMLYLRGEAGSGTVTTELTPGKKVTIEVQGEDWNVEPRLQGEQLAVDLEMHVQGTLGEVPAQTEINDKTIREMENQLAETCQVKAEKALHKLQKELQTDILEFGSNVYRKYPQQWQEVKENWDEIFARADVNLHITTSISHKELINQTKGGIYDKPQWIPFKFLD